MKKIAIALCSLALPMLLAAQSTVKDDKGQEVTVQQVRQTVDVTTSTFEAGATKTDNPDITKPNTLYKCSYAKKAGNAMSFGSMKACCKSGAVKACCLSKQSQVGAGAKAAQAVQLR